MSLLKHVVGAEQLHRLHLYSEVNTRAVTDFTDERVMFPEAAKRKGHFK